MTGQKLTLTRAAFWDRLCRAARHIGKLPDWIKGSPRNERPAPLYTLYAIYYCTYCKVTFASEINGVPPECGECGCSGSNVVLKIQYSGYVAMTEKEWTMTFAQAVTNAQAAIAAVNTDTTAAEQSLTQLQQDTNTAIQALQALQAATQTELAAIQPLVVPGA